MKSVVALAHELHGGTNVYKSLHDCLQVLYAVEALQPPWWTANCAGFLRHAGQLEKHASSSSPLSCSDASGVTQRKPIVLVEGLDGTGKTLITHTLAEKLHGVALSTPPPQFAVIREAFRHQDEAVARAFYSAANYIAAEDILARAQTSPVVVDRWWCSTCAMALANQFTVDRLPPPGDEVYTWPSDLIKPDAGFVLSVEEAVRVARIRKRAPEDAEERRLSTQSEMRRAAMEAFARTKMLTVVPAPTYRAAVNTILAEMPELGVAHQAEAFTEAELKSITPF
ncbi:Thymidylate kinase [Lotmaria passim]